jgi:hypothetical protein
MGGGIELAQDRVSWMSLGFLELNPWILIPDMFGWLVG